MRKLAGSFSLWPTMLRTRLYLGLLPLLLLFIAVCVVAAFRYRDLSQSINKSVTDNYQALVSGYEMREAATLMAGSLATAQRGDIITARRAYAEQRARFQRYFTEQSLAAVDTPRAALLGKIDDAFGQFNETARVPLDQDEAISVASLREVDASLVPVLKTVEALTQSDYAEVQAAAERSDRLVRRSMNFLFGAMVAGILLSLYLSSGLVRIFNTMASKRQSLP